MMQAGHGCPMVRIPYKLLRDFSVDGALGVVLHTCLHYKTAQGWRRMEWQNSGKQEGCMEMLRLALQELQVIWNSPHPCGSHHRKSTSVSRSPPYLLTCVQVALPSACVQRKGFYTRPKVFFKPTLPASQLLAMKVKPRTSCPAPNPECPARQGMCSFPYCLFAEVPECSGPRRRCRK